MTEVEIRERIAALTVALAGEFPSYESTKRRLLTDLLAAYEQLVGLIRIEHGQPEHIAVKAPNGAGSTYRRSSDARWVAAVQRNGKRIAAYGATPEEAEAKLEHGATQEDGGAEPAATLAASGNPPAPSPSMGQPEQVAEPVAAATVGTQVTRARNEPAPAPTLTCSDCGTSIVSGTICHACAGKRSGMARRNGQPKQPLTCPDCGAGVKRPGARCKTCAANKRWADAGEARAKVPGAGVQPMAETDPSPWLSAIPDPPPAAAALPKCACPSTWWTAASWSLGKPQQRSDQHNHLCPLHAHRHLFGNTPDDEGNLVGKCACGNVELRPQEPENGYSAKSKAHREATAAR